MIRALIKKISHSLGATTNEATAQKIAVSSLNFDTTAINASAVSTCLTLQEAGFEAYVVGGAVRDLLLGIVPKDFDVATSASPEQVKKLFRRAYIIGRRFKIVHVVHGRELIEVTTFRGGVDSGDTDEHGRVVSDNVYGTLPEDAKRRDFTINALYYDPQRQEILDYTNALGDIKKKRLVLIGDPAKRFTEDPVRILRALRLAAKTACGIDKKTGKLIAQCAPLLANVPQPRLHDESLKLILSGYSLKAFELFTRYQLPLHALPLLAELQESMRSDTFIRKALENSDERVQSGKYVTEGFLFACLLWRKVQQAKTTLKTSDVPANLQWPEAADLVLDHEAKALNLTRKNTVMMRDIWLSQSRFTQRNQATAIKFAAHERFRAAYDFYCLRAEAGDADAELAKWWSEFYQLDDPQKLAMINAERDRQRRINDAQGISENKNHASKPRRPKRKKRASAVVVLGRD